MIRSKTRRERRVRGREGKREVKGNNKKRREVTREGKEGLEEEKEREK